jgi:hypothetical protein
LNSSCLDGIVVDLVLKLILDVDPEHAKEVLGVLLFVEVTVLVQV